MKGRPFVRAVNLPEGVELKHLYVTEFRNKKVLGLLSGADHSLYVLNNRTYEVVKVGVSSFDPESDELTYWGICSIGPSGYRLLVRIVIMRSMRMIIH